MLIEAAGGKVDWTAYPDQAAVELIGLIAPALSSQGRAEDRPRGVVGPLAR
jgi:hypothetical protein